MQETALKWREKGLKIGLIPTMGSLHSGHLSLTRAAARQCDKTVLSIFVNPAQFAPGEDYLNYPRNLAQDIKKAFAADVSCVFVPEAPSMYQDGYATYVQVEGLSQGLCGSRRPGHFRGVCTVVLKLFNISLPHKAYFGRKDAQQCVIVKKMAEDLNLPLEICSMPIVRERDGLAKSSRNAYLNAEERRQAAIIYRALLSCKKACAGGESSSRVLKEKAAAIINTMPLTKIDYIEIVESSALKAMDAAAPGAMMCAAVFIGKTRLIDNILLWN
jgi:pantoate--beta-alanine ligase